MRASPNENGILMIQVLPKKSMIKNRWYAGICRNAQVAKWDGEKFWYWRRKWQSTFQEDILHWDDRDKTPFDVFIPIIELKYLSEELDEKGFDIKP